MPDLIKVTVWKIEDLGFKHPHRRVNYPSPRRPRKNLAGFHWGIKKGPKLGKV